MDADRRLSLTVGGLVITSLAVLAAVIVSLTAQQGIFAPRYRLVAKFQNVQGLLSGAPVWLSGKRVGRVESVAFASGPSFSRGVEVVLQVDAEVRERIRRDSVASIGTIGLLGDRYVEVSSGTDQAAVLADGGEIATLDPVDFSQVLDQGARALDLVARKGELALDEISALAANLNTTLNAFELEETGRLLSNSIEGVGAIVSEIQQGDGLMHSLVYDSYEGGGVDNAERLVSDLQHITGEIRNGDGTLHRLIYSSPGDADLFRQAGEASGRLNGILTRIDEGEGTLGLLVNDPTLYEEIKLLVGGANRSAVVRGMVRMLSEPE